MSEATVPEAEISEAAIAVILGFFLSGLKQSLSYGGHGAEMEPTPNMAAAVEELLAVDLLDKSVDENGRITLRGRDWNRAVVAARVGNPFTWMEERGDMDLGFRKKSSRP